MKRKIAAFFRNRIVKTAIGVCLIVSASYLPNETPSEAMFKLCLTITAMSTLIELSVPSYHEHTR